MALSEPRPVLPPGEAGRPRSRPQPLAEERDTREVAAEQTSELGPAHFGDVVRIQVPRALGVDLAIRRRDDQKPRARRARARSPVRATRDARRARLLRSTRRRRSSGPRNGRRMASPRTAPICPATAAASKSRDTTVRSRRTHYVASVSGSAGEVEDAKTRQCRRSQCVAVRMLVSQVGPVTGRLETFALARPPIPPGAFRGVRPLGPHLALRSALPLLS